MPLTEPKPVNEMSGSRGNGEWTWHLWGELGGLQHEEETLQTVWGDKRLGTDHPEVEQTGHLWGNKVKAKFQRK